MLRKIVGIELTARWNRINEDVLFNVLVILDLVYDEHVVFNVLIILDLVYNALVLFNVLVVLDFVCRAQMTALIQRVLLGNRLSSGS